MKTEINITLEQAARFNNVASEWLKTATDTKLKYAVKRVLDQTNKDKHFKGVQEVDANYLDAVLEAEINHAKEDENGILLRDEKDGYKYTKDNAIKLAKKKAELTKDWKAKSQLQLNKTIPITPHIIDLTEEQIDALGYHVEEAFRSIVIPENDTKQATK